MMKRFPAVALAVLMIASPPAWAQPAGPERQLSLAEAVRLARENSLAARVSQSQLEATQADRAAAVAQALPQLSVQTSANYNQLPGLGAGGLGGFGNIVGFPAAGVTVDTTLNGSTPLFNLATTDAIAIADQQITASRWALEAAWQDAMLNASVAYFEVLRAQGLAQVAETTLKAAQDALRLGELRLRAGTGTRATVLQLRAQASNAQSDLIRARNAANVARLTLANAMNVPVADQPLDADPRVPSLEVEVAAALPVRIDRRPDIRQLALREEIDRRRVDLESRAVWPSLNGVTRYSQRGLNQGQFLAGVTLNWTLFDGFQVRNRMRSAQSQAEADRAQLELSRQRAALEIRQFDQTRQEASARIETAREGLAAAQEAYRLAIRRFEVGLATTFELNDVLTTLNQAGNSYVQAMNDARVAEVRLARALGYDLGGYLAAR